MELGTVGIWWSGSWGDAARLAERAAEIEQLGYGTIWLSGGFSPGLSDRFGALLAATEHTVVASGIVSIWVNQPVELAGAVAELVAAYPGRFLLGLGVSHAPLVERAGRRYDRPYRHMVGFLDDLDEAGMRVGPESRALAALGPRMLELARERAAGAHPYFVPVEHTARARELLGAGPILAPEVAVVVETDPVEARRAARSYAEGYLRLPNYANNLRSLGFSDEDVAGAGSDRLIDAVVPWGSPETLARRIAEHHQAGADHICIQVVAGRSAELPVSAYRQLASALGI